MLKKIWNSLMMTLFRMYISIGWARERSFYSQMVVKISIENMHRHYWAFKKNPNTNLSKYGQHMCKKKKNWHWLFNINGNINCFAFVPFFEVWA